MIDTHAHIDDAQYAEGLDEFIAAQRADGVEAIVVPSINAASIESVCALADRYPGYCFPAAGLHPEEVGAGWREELDKIEAALDRRAWTAIGEIGLDYHWDTTWKREQQEVLEAQLDWATDRDLPVMIHSRDATEDILTMLKPYCAKGLRGVMHCFTGSKETAKRITDMGLYVGIGGVITFKNAKLSETLREVPRERVLTETDSPYMAPVPYRGQRNEPRWMRYVLDRIGEVYGITAREADFLTTCNARALFGL